MFSYDDGHSCSGGGHSHMEVTGMCEHDLKSRGLSSHLKLRGQNIDPLMGSISFNSYRGQINHDLGHFLQHQNNPEKGRF